MQNRKLVFAAAVFWALLILALSLMPRFSAGGAPLNHGLFAHLAAYATLGGLIFFCLVTQGAARARVAGFLIAGLWGVLVEIGQACLSYRTFDPYDIILNLAAAGVGSYFAVFFKTFLART